MNFTKFLFIVVTAFFLLNCGNASKKEVAATVGDTVVYVDDILKEFERFVSFSEKVSKGKMPEKDSELWIKMLKGYAREVVDRTILLSWGSKRGINLDIEKVEAEYDKLRSDTASYNKIISMQPMDTSEFKNNFTRYLLLKKIMMTAYYELFNSDFNFENIHAAHILFLAPDSIEKNDSVKNFAYAIYDSLKAGKKFEILAKTYSQCPSASDGGDLGKFSRGTLKKEFEEVAVKLKKGEFSAPIKTSVGFHLIKLLDTLEKKEQSLETAAPDIADLLNDSQNQVKVIEALRDSIVVTKVWEKIK